MEQRSVLILCQDARYANRLQAELIKQAPDLSVSVATDPAKAGQLLERSYALMACTKALLPRRAPGDAKLVRIVDAQEVRGAELCIAQDVGAAESGARRIIEALAHRCRIVGVTSPCGGAGKTSYAWGLSCAAARAGCSPFFLSLEGFMGTNPFAKNTAVGFDQVLCALDHGDVLAERLRQASCRHEDTGVSTFVPGERMIDREELSSQGVRALLLALKNQCLWDTIVVDMESCMDERMLQVWDMAERMVLVLPCAAQAELKKQAMQRELNLLRARDRDYWGKIVPVLNRVNPESGYELGASAAARSFGALDVVSAQRLVVEADRMDAAEWLRFTAANMSSVFDKLLTRLAL